MSAYREPAQTLDDDGPPPHVVRWYRLHARGWWRVMMSVRMARDAGINAHESRQRERRYWLRIADVWWVEAVVAMLRAEP